MPTPDEKLDEQLQQAIAAARAGQKARARALLAQVLKAAPDNVTAWLWLSGVLEDPLEQERCLERVLSLDPQHSAARKGLAAARRRSAQALLAQGVEAAQAGDRARAREYLTQAAERDEENATLWLWLSRVVETPEEQEICFENVLTLDPNNAEAIQGLDLLQQVRAEAVRNPWGKVDGAEASDEERDAPTLAAAVLGDAYREKYTVVVPEPEPEPEHPALAAWEKYEDETRCVYCGAPTEYENRRCPTCGKALWVKVRRREERSTLLWILIMLQAFNTVMAAATPVILLYFVSLRLGVEDDFAQLFQLYFGNARAVSPQVASQVLARLPRLVYYLAWLPALGSTALTVALYLRWPPVFYLMLVNAALTLFFSVTGMVMQLSLGPIAVGGGLIGIVSALVGFLLTLRLEDDFLKDSVRLLLRVEKGLNDRVACLRQGRRYAEEKMWALAAIYLRRAAGWFANNSAAYMALAAACLQIEEPVMAEMALDEARRITPEHPELAALTAQLDAQRGVGRT